MGKKSKDTGQRQESCCPGSTPDPNLPDSKSELQKELKEALCRLENCCPGSTGGANQQISSLELHEALLNLDRAREREQRLREESDALLEAMDIFINSENTRKAFSMVLEVLKKLLGFDDAFVLREQKNGSFSTVASSSLEFENLVWQPGPMLKHVVSGNSVNLRDISNSIDWQGQPLEIRRNVISALHTPFHTTTDRAILVCTSSQEAFFKKSSIHLLERFSPLGGQALYNIEINDRLRDEISERKKAEDALREAYDDLERRIEQRTYDLRASNILLQREINERERVEKEKEEMFAQFLQSQKMESIGQLAGSVAHDFNNILTIILGYSEMIMLTKLKDEPIWSHIETIHEAGERAAALTRQLLAFSRKQVMELQVVNLNALITNMTKMVGRLIGEKIEMELLLGSPVGNIMADPGQVEQIIMNLAVNSRDAMPNGGHLSIQTEDIFLNEEELAKLPGMRTGAYVRLSIQDTGEGMSKEIQAQIFEPFFTTKVQGKGTGLGLATVYGIVKQHNGNIYVESELGKGTRVTSYFPVTEKKALEHETTLPKSNTFRTGTETVLVVDDDASIRSFVTNTLTPFGYTCLKAANGNEALNIVQTSEKAIDLLLTDVVMPEMNGPELAKLFRKQAPESKVIFMSGYISDVEFDGIIVRKEAFIPKPLTPQKLLNKLGEVLDHKLVNRNGK